MDHGDCSGGVVASGHWGEPRLSQWRWSLPPSAVQFLQEWRYLVESQSGERGIFNLAGIRKHTHDMVPHRDIEKILGTNPCGEIALRDMGFCNLSEVIIKEDDSVDDIKNKVASWRVLVIDSGVSRDIPILSQMDTLTEEIVQLTEQRDNLAGADEDKL